MQGAQKAAGGQNQQGLPPGQAAKGINGDQIGQSQPQAGRGKRMVSGTSPSATERASARAVSTAQRVSRRRDEDKGERLLSE